MFTLVIGGAASGKSEYAEALAVRLGRPLVYLATMQPMDEECRLRVLRHRKQREGKGFLTVERYTDLAGVSVSPNASILLECLSNLMANELYMPEGGGEEAVLSGVGRLLDSCRHLTVVTNEVFSGGADYGPDTLQYLRTLAEVNRLLARQADTVVEVAAGCPNFLKGGWPA